MTRPIFFFVVFWGERFRGYCANILLRSLLAPGNLPVLAGSDGHKLLLCCPAADWQALDGHPAFAAAARHVELVHVPLDPPPAGRYPVDHMSIGHLLATALCFEAKAYGSLLHPDMLFAQGFVAALLRRAADGTEALFVPALRLAEAQVFTRLRLDERLESGDALNFTPRTVVAAAMASLHDEIAECEMDGPRLSMLPNCVWWRSPEGSLLAHGFSWSPLLIDYGSIQRHRTDEMRGPLADGDYIARNFASDARIAFVSDSDEIVFASWTPAAVGARERRPSFLQNLPVLGRWLRRAILRRAYLHYTRDFYPLGDHVKAKGFRVPLKFHVRDLDSSWDALEMRAGREMAVSIGDLLDPPSAPKTWRTALLDRLIPALKPYESAQRKAGSLRFIRGRAMAALRGDVEARAWFSSRLRARHGPRA